MIFLPVLSHATEDFNWENTTMHTIEVYLFGCLMYAGGTRSCRAVQAANAILVCSVMASMTDIFAEESLDSSQITS